MKNTRSRKQYAMRLTAIALITQVPFYLCHSYSVGEPVTAMFTSWNIMSTLFLGLLVLIVWDSKWKLPVRIFVMLAITGTSYLINAEWKEKKARLELLCRDSEHMALYAKAMVYVHIGIDHLLYDSVISLHALRKSMFNRLSR